MTTPTLHEAARMALETARTIIAADRSALVAGHQVSDARAYDAVAHGLHFVGDGVWIEPEAADAVADYDRALAQIDAALAASEAQAEPVAWVGPVFQLMPHVIYEAWAAKYPDDAAHFKPLVLAHPPAAQAAPQQPAPLTLDEIGQLEFGGAVSGVHWDTIVSIVRATERAHGITTEKP